MNNNRPCPVCDFNNVKEIRLVNSYVGGPGIAINSTIFPSLESVYGLFQGYENNINYNWRNSVTNPKIDLSGLVNSTNQYCTIMLTSSWGSNRSAMIKLPLTNPSLYFLQLQSKFKNYDDTTFNTVDASGYTNIRRLNISNCPEITSLIGVNNKTQLQELHMDGTPISTLNIAGSTGIEYLYASSTNWTPATTDDVLIKLANGNRNYGFIRHRNNRTSMSDVARQNLLNRNWTIQAY